MQNLYQKRSKTKKPSKNLRAFFVGLLGLEPRLFWTKTRRVASYTIGHCCNADANLKQSFIPANIFLKKFNSESNKFLETIIEF